MSPWSSSICLKVIHRHGTHIQTLRKIGKKKKKRQICLLHLKPQSISSKANTVSSFFWILLVKVHYMYACISTAVVTSMTISFLFTATVSSALVCTLMHFFFLLMIYVKPLCIIWDQFHSVSLWRWMCEGRLRCFQFWIYRQTHLGKLLCLDIAYIFWIKGHIHFICWQAYLSWSSPMERVSWPFLTISASACIRMHYPIWTPQ